MLVDIGYTIKVNATYDIPDHITNSKDFKTWFFENYDSSLVNSWIKIYDSDFEYNYIEKYT